MARRRRGTGSVFKRADGRIAGKLTVDGVTTYVYGETKEVVEAKLDAALRNREQGRVAFGSKMPLNEYLWWWLDHIAARHMAYNTLAIATGNIRRIEPVIGGVSLRKLQPHHGYQLVSRLEREYAPKTVSMALSMLKRALTEAVRLSLMPSNPMLHIRSPRQHQSERTTLTRDEARHFLNATRPTDDYALWLTMLSTGMRPGETLALHWKDVNLDDGVITVRHTLIEIRGRGQEITAPKTPRGVRQIAVDVGVVEALREHRLRLAGRHMRVPTLVFPGRTGAPAWRKNVQERLHTALKHAGLPRLSLHELRHTAATLLLEGGEYINVVQERLGHANASTTLGIYAHTQPHMQKAAAERMGRILREVDEPVEPAHRTVKDGA